MARRGRTRSVKISSGGSYVVPVDPIFPEKHHDISAIDIPIVDLVKRKSTLETLISNLKSKPQYKNFNDVSLYRIAAGLLKRKTCNQSRSIGNGNIKPNFKLK